MTAEERRNRGAWRQYRMLAALVLLAAGVLGYWALGERTPGREDSPAASLLIPAASLPAAAGRNLDEVTIEQSGAPAFSLQRRRSGPDPGFSLRPPGSRADDALAEELVGALLSAVAERRLAGAAATAEGRRAYGVEADQCRLRVRFAPAHVLCFGAEAPTGAVYTRLDASPDVLLAGSELYARLARPAAHYRAHHLAPATLASAHAIELGSLQLRRDPALWQVRAPKGEWVLADPAQVEALLRRLHSWSVAAWAEAPSTPPGAAPLRLVIDGNELLRGGWPCPTGAARTRLFQRGDSEWLCADDPGAAGLQPDWPTLRAERLVPLPLTEIAQLRAPGGVDLRLADDGTYTQAGQPADTASARQLLSRLTEARASREATESPPAGAARLEVTTTAGQRIPLQLWPSGAATLVQRAGEPTLRLDEPAPALLATSGLQLMPRTLWTLAPAAVQQIERRAAVTERLVRAGGWQLRAPTGAPASSAAVGLLLQDLADLRVERWDAAAPRPEHGLEAPRLRLTVTSAPGDRPDRELGLLVGAAADSAGDCYVQRLGGGPVGVLAAPTCAALAQPLVSPLLLRLDEQRLARVQLSPAGAAPLPCAVAAGAWQCGGQPLVPAVQRDLLQALRGLQRGEAPSYAAPSLPLRLTLQVEHQPLPTGGALPGEDVAPPSQTLRLYGGPASWQARLADRAVTYQLPADAGPALERALAAAQQRAP